MTGRWRAGAGGIRGAGENMRTHSLFFQADLRKYLAIVAALNISCTIDHHLLIIRQLRDVAIVCNRSQPTLAVPHLCVANLAQAADAQLSRMRQKAFKTWRLLTDSAVEICQADEWLRRV